MAQIVRSNVCELVTVSGTGPIILAGVSAGVSYQTFSASMADGDTTFIACVDKTSGSQQFSAAIYSASMHSLTITTIYQSSNGGAQVNFPGGECFVYMQVPPSASGSIGSVVTVDPTAPNSLTSLKFQGVGSLLVPVSSGRVMCIVTGTISGSGTSVGDGIILELYYKASLSLPGNGGSISGYSAAGAIMEYTTSSGGNVLTPFCVQAVVTGLSVGTSYAFDLAAQSVIDVAAIGLANVTFSAVEV